MSAGWFVFSPHPDPQTARGSEPREFDLSQHSGSTLVPPECPPAEGEGATDQPPVTTDGLIGAHLILSPAQALLHLFVALLNPNAQALEMHHGGQIGHMA